MSDHCQALVLDFGGVVTRTMFETHDMTEQALGLTPGTLSWRGPFDPENDSLWQSMQSGEISERDYWLERTRQTGRLIGRKWDRMEQFIVAARSGDPMKIIRQQALDAVTLAKRSGRKLAILSNELDLFYGADFRDKLPFLREFDLIVDATHTNILKPDPRAYALVTNGLHLPAGACVFVDDQMKNIDGARRAGMKTIHFDVRNPAAGYREALALLGLGNTRLEASHDAA